MIRIWSKFGTQIYGQSLQLLHQSPWNLGEEFMPVKFSLGERQHCRGPWLPQRRLLRRVRFPKYARTAGYSPFRNCQACPLVEPEAIVGQYSRPTSTYRETPFDHAVTLGKNP